MLESREDCAEDHHYQDAHHATLTKHQIKSADASTRPPSLLNYGILAIIN
jgi:hypothetical protein